MSDTTNIDLALILRNTEHAARDAAAAMAATELLVVSVAARFDAIEARIGGLEGRMTGLERRMSAVERGVDGIIRSNLRIEQMLTDISGKIGA